MQIRGPGSVIIDNHQAGRAGPTAKIKRRANVIGIFPNDDAIIRLSAPSSWSKTTNGPSNQPAYMTLETIAPISENPHLSPCPPRQDEQPGQAGRRRCSMSYTTPGDTIRAALGGLFSVNR